MFQTGVIWSPVLHAGGERLHTGSDGPDGEAGLGRGVRVREDGLDHLQNISVPAEDISVSWYSRI